MLPPELIDEIGEYVGFKMWSKRDDSKEYDFPGSREDNRLAGDEFLEGHDIVFNRVPLLVFKHAGCFHRAKSVYTLNLITVKPTAQSRIKKVLSPALIGKIKSQMANVRY
jgi:hypothetical protein